MDELVCVDKHSQMKPRSRPSVAIFHNIPRSGGGSDFRPWGVPEILLGLVDWEGGTRGLIGCSQRTQVFIRLLGIDLKRYRQTWNREVSLSTGKLLRSDVIKGDVTF